MCKFCHLVIRQQFNMINLQTFACVRLFGTIDVLNVQDLRTMPPVCTKRVYGHGRLPGLHIHIMAVM